MKYIYSLFFVVVAIVGLTQGHVALGFCLFIFAWLSVVPCKKDGERGKP